MKKYVNVDIELVKSKFRPIEKEAHKGIQGHALIIGGSYGKIGSVSLSSKACLKSGTGLVTAYIPKCGYDIIQVLNPEVMVITDECHDYISSIHTTLSIQAVGVGMGMGLHKETQQAFLQFLKMTPIYFVIPNIIHSQKDQSKDWSFSFVTNVKLPSFRVYLDLHHNQSF